jgi:hypothetical protein
MACTIALSACVTSFALLVGCVSCCGAVIGAVSAGGLRDALVGGREEVV